MKDSSLHKMFDDIEVIGRLPPEQTAAKLRELEEGEAPERSQSDLSGVIEKGLFDRTPKPWQHTSHQFGYIPPSNAGVSHPQMIRHAGNMAADQSLKNGRINIHLDRLRVQEYPGRGGHQVLFTFKAQNQLPNMPEPASFSQTYRIQEGQQAGISGLPIFIGLNVGTIGAVFQVFTVNVKNNDDEALLKFLDSPTFQGGLNLLSTAQPVIKPFTEMALGVTRMLASRNRNVVVQDFYMGLDFSDTTFGVRLSVGSYIAVQVPSENTINWSDWIFSPQTGNIVRKQDQSSLPYNYVVFRITRHEG